MPEERRIAAWLGASLVIEGNLASSEDTTIAGQVRGDVAIREHGLVVSPGGRIQGDITARSVTVHGEVFGNITAMQTVEISASGKVAGDVRAPRMVIGEGAVLNGRVVVGAAAARG